MAQRSGAAASVARVGLKEKLKVIRCELCLAPELSIAAAAKLANDMMGVEEAGTLPEQVEHLLEVMGLRGLPEKMAVICGELCLDFSDPAVTVASTLDAANEMMGLTSSDAVSYTHLTLPTKA